MEMTTHAIAHAFEHSLADTLYLAPFLLVTYFAIEWLEHRKGAAAKSLVSSAGVAGPVLGSILGVLPQCGFSAAAAAFYSKRALTLGTLLAVFMSTSDEMLPIFIASQVPVATIAGILLVKIAIGMVTGFLIDGFLRIRGGAAPEVDLSTEESSQRCCCGNIGAYGMGLILRGASLHALKIMAFIFVVTLLLNCILEIVGEDRLFSLLGDGSVLAVFVSALVGLIPNCASSVVIAQLYAEGVLGTGAMLSGLLVSSGAGLLVLARLNRPVKETVAIVAFLFAAGVIWGLLANTLLLMI